ncbi:hypothetical protein HQ560_00645, partial [bacterium]|nr:hypothetical protein [bacterium]
MVRFKHSVLAFALLSMPFAHGLGAAFKAIPADKAQSGMAMMEDGAHLLVQHTSADLISVWDVKAQKVVKVLKTKAPQHILCRGRKAFVANYNFGTISVFDSSRDWAKVDEVLTGNQMVYYLSAPGGRNFKNRILASCGKYTSHEYYLVDLSRDAAKLLHKEIYASVATLSYDGSHIIVQGEFSSSPSATVASYPTQTFVDGTRKGKARGNHESTSFLHQVGAGNFWFGLHTLYSGIPPKPFGDKLGTFIIPDVTRDVFYIVDKGFASTHRRTTSRPELAREKITYPSTYTKAKRASSRRFTKTYGYQCPVATTRDDKAYLYIYDPPTSHVYQCAIAAGKTPASVAEAEPKAPDAPDALPAAGPENFPKQVAEGEKVSHRLYARNVAGVFSIAQGPAGIRISTNGILTWTPGPKDRGPQQIKIRAQVGGEVSFLRISTEVAPKGAPAAVASAKPGTGKPEPTPTPAAPKATVQEVAAIPTDAPATGMGITEDGAFLLIAHESSNQISVWDVKAQKVIKILSCLSPRHILCRGGKAFVANYNKGTISVFDARKNWALVNEVLAGNPLVYHLSAPGGKHFKGSVLASCGKYTRREFYVVDTIKDSTKLLKKEGYASVATFSYDGVHIIIQGEFGHSPSATVHSYVAKELMTNPRANGAMGNHDDTPYLYQVHEGSFWFGRLNVYAEMPPKPFGKSFTGMIMPDVTRKVFYTLMPTVATTHALNAAMTELATHPVTLSEKWKKSPSRHAHPKSIGARNAWAATHGDKAYLYDYNPGVKAVFQCIIPAKGGAATVAGTAPRTTPATPGAVARPEAPPVAGAENFPKKIFEGKPLSFRLYAGDVTGAFAVLGGPAGVRISPKGVLTWTPTAKDKGAHQIKVKAEIAGQTSFLRLSTEVLGKEIAALTGGDVARVDDLGVHYLTSGLRGVSVHPRDKTVLLLAASDLRILDPSGIKALRTIPLEHSYVRLAARAKGYVAVANDALHVLDGKTLKPIRKVKLPGSGVTDLALHPNKPVSYVAVHDNEGGKLNPLAARKVACVDESGGRVKILSRVLGQWLAVHPSGRHLYAGIHETYRAGYRLDWNVGAVMPDYGDIDVVVSYEIVGTSIRHRHTNTTPGANGRALRMAPDGAHVAYISGGGYRSGAPQLNGYTIPAFSTDDIRKAAVSYNTDAYPKDVSFHPSLDLVAATNGGTIGIFRRKSGEKIENKLDTGGRKLKDIARLIFTPDGRRLLVDSKDESGRRALRSLG